MIAHFLKAKSNVHPPERRSTRRALLVLTLALTLPVAAAEFRAGAAKSCITPPLGSTVNGGVGPGTARHIHDDLFVRALVLDDGATQLALAVVDTCVVDRPVFDEAKALIQRHAGLPPSQIMLSASHTHSAGAVCGVHLSDPDPAYRALLPGRIADAVRCAVNHLAPAELAWGSGSLPQHVFCRRLLVKPGMTYTNQLGYTHELAKMNWDSPHPADGEPAGPTDPEVFVLSVRHEDGRPLALLANYSLHYVGDVGPGHVSADYFGVFADRIQQLLGADRQEPPFIAMLSNGTSGDINNINPRAKREPQPPYTHIRRVAEDLAQEVLRVTKGLAHRRDVKLRAAQRECVVAIRRPNAAEVAQARAFLAGRPVATLSGWPDNFAREQLFLAEWPAEVSLPLQVFRIGELAVAAWPGEIFASSGLELKRRSPVQPLFNVGLANGWYGYIPPPEQFPYGAYETWRMRTSPLETNAIPKMLDGFLSLIETSRPQAAHPGDPRPRTDAISPAFPLKVSENQRYLEDQAGKPFLVVGDTAWSLITQLKPDEIIDYLDDRQRRGFSALIVNLIEHKFADRAPAMIDGTQPFLAPGDFARPNPAYFDRACQAVRAAHQRGISVWLCPAYLGWTGGDEGFWQDIKQAGPAALRTYAGFVGQRFKDLPNIIWMIGGDYALPDHERWAGHEVARGLRDGGARQLITAHGGQTTAVDTFGHQPWLAIDTVYRYQHDLWRPLQANWSKEPARPYVMIESAYEGEHQTTPARLRAQAWWSMTSGACGQFFGNNPIWYFDGRAYEFAKHKSAPSWRVALDLPGSRDIARLAAFFAKLPWHTLAPDLDARVLTAGAGSGKDRATCAASADGRLAVIYVPTPRSFTVNLARFGGPVIARWFDPTQGEFAPTGDAALGGQQAELRPPATNAAGDPDWVLLLESAARLP